MTATAPTKPNLRGSFRLNWQGLSWNLPAMGVLAMGVPMLVLLVMGRPGLLGYASLSAFAINYVNNRSYNTRLRLVPFGLAILWGSSLTGSLVSRVTDLLPVQMVVLAVVAVATQYLTAVFRSGLPGGLMPTFACALGFALPVPPGGLRPAVIVMVLSGLWTFAVTMAGSLLSPHGPERRSVAQALRAVADRVDAIGTNREESEHLRAALALQQGWHAALAGFRTDDQTRVFQRWCTAAEAAMHRARAGRGDPLTTRLLRDAAVTFNQPHGWPEPPPDNSPIGGTGHAILQRTPVPSWREMARRIFSSPQFVPPALRVGLAAAVCLLVAALLGLQHPAWTVLTCTAVLQTPTRVNTVTRAVQRSSGTLLGMIIAVPILFLVRDPWLALLVAVACHALSLALANVNYALLLVPVTPMALLLVSIGLDHTAWEVVGERMLDTVIGAVIAVAIAYLVPNKLLAVSVDAAENHLITSIIKAMLVPANAPADQRADASFELVHAMTNLRVAYNEASGEPWPSDYNIDMATISHLVDEGHEELIRLNPPPAVGNPGGGSPSLGHPSMGHPSMGSGPTPPAKEEPNG